MEKLNFRFAKAGDGRLILDFIKQLAAYERLSGEVVATENILEEWLFVRKKAEVIIGEVGGVPVGFALFFHNFSTFLGKAGIYLEDLFINEKFRGRGYGKAFLKKLAQITLERECGRLDWSCLDWNKNSIDFYTSLGAVALEDWTTYRLTGETLERTAK